MELESFSLDLPWLADASRQWNIWLSNKQLPHALLLQGSWMGDGIDEWTNVSLKRLFCVSGDACDRCESCLWMDDHHHPDLVYIEPAEKSRIIPVDDIRSAIDHVRLAAHQGGWRVVLIKDAERMNLAASNALLKTLEEPGENVLVCLQSARPSLLPETVRSRCLSLDLRADQSSASKWLQERHPGVAMHDLQLILAATEGPIEAKAWLHEGKLLQVQQVANQIESMLADGSLHPFPESTDLSASAVLALMAWVLRQQIPKRSPAALEALISEWWDTSRVLPTTPLQLQMATVKALWVRWIALCSKMSHS